MGLAVTKSVFRVFDQVIPKPACSATETSCKFEISTEAKLDLILYKKRMTKVLIRLPGWSAPLLFANL